jgi:ribosomal protein S18 acetylase RimI-like enzyme
MTTGEAVTLEDAQPGDAAELAAFFAFAFTDTFGHLYPPEDLGAFLATTGEAAFAAELADPRFHIRVARAAERIRGFCKVGPPSLPFEPGPRRAIELRQLYVAPELKGAGVAAALMDWALATARDRSFEDIYLSVFIENHRARRFYERYGFEEVGTYGFRVGNIVDDDRVMRLGL